MALAVIAIIALPLLVGYAYGYRQKELPNYKNL
jgi:hypothetical protein